MSVNPRQMDPNARFVSHSHDKRQAHENLKAQGYPQWDPEHRKPEALCAYCLHAGAEHPGFETNPMMALACNGIDNNGDPCRCAGWTAEVLERQHEHLIQAGFVVVEDEQVPDIAYVEPLRVEPIDPDQWVYCNRCGQPAHPQVINRPTSGWRIGARGPWEGQLYCPACVAPVLMSIPEPHDPAPLVEPGGTL